MVLFQYLDHLPQVPEYLILDIVNGIKAMPVHNMPPMRSITNGNHQFENISYKRYTPSEELTDWIRNNISDQYTTFGVQIQDPGQHNHRHAPHADAAFRNWVLNYIINTGGSNAVTSWYQQHGEPVLRPTTEAFRPADISHYEPLESVQIEPRRWHLLKASVLHGVENIESERIAISLGFEPDPIGQNLLCQN